jgi:hypothetical protein
LQKKLNLQVLEYITIENTNIINYKMSKTAPKKTAPKKVAVVKGCVGYFYGGVLKVGSAWVFSSESEDPQSVYDEARTYLGRYTTCKYVVCENASDVFEKLKEEISDAHDFGSVYLIHSSTLFDKLKEVSGVDRCKNLKEKPEKDAPEDAPAEVAAKIPVKKGVTAKATPAPVASAKKPTPGKSGKKAVAVQEEEVEAEDVEVEEDDDAEDVEDVEDDDEDDDDEAEDEDAEDEEEEVAPPPPPTKKGGVKATPAKAPPAKTTVSVKTAPKKK